MQQALTPMCARGVCSRRSMALLSNLLLGPGYFSHHSCIDWSSYLGGSLACYGLIFLRHRLLCQPTRNTGKKSNLRVNHYSFLFGYRIYVARATGQQWVWVSRRNP